MKYFRLELKQWLAIFVLFLAGTLAANAYDLTISDGKQIDGRLPMYGLVADTYQKSEYVIPADLLVDLKGTTINGLTYYVKSQAQRLYLGQCIVFVKEVDFSEYTETKFVGYDNDDQIVYTGGLNAMGTEMTIPFNTPYKYTGKSLLIGIYIIDKNNVDPGASVGFLGNKTDYYTGISAYNSSAFVNFDERAELVKFLPMLTLSCDNTPHDVTYNSHDGKVTMSFTGLDSNNQALVGKDITATVTDVANGWVISNVRDDYGTTLTDEGSDTYSFTMPDNWVYINSDLKRDIAIEVYVTEPLPLATNEPLRFTTKEDVKFTLWDKLDQDDTKWKELTAADYEVTFKDKATGNAVDAADVEGNEGAYTATFTGKGDYTNYFTVDFNVQEMYEVTLPAHYFGTYFYANAIETFDDLDLATVTAVAADGTATLTKLTETKVAKNYPFLIYNPFDEEKTFTLWETIEDVTPANPTPAAQFTGTAEAKAFTAEETAAKDYYVLQNGKEFVYVIGAGTKPAHRCWIELEKASGARILTIAIDQTTGISEVKAAANADGWYDLQGRRMTTMPTQRGLYVIEGKKVVVK